VHYSADDFDVSELVDAGHVDIETHLDPPSLQASLARKAEYRTALAAAIARGTTRCFTHDVAVTLRWVITEERRYHTHVVADLDNVLKPTIDALVGPDSILFDDNQVQAIDASWHTGPTPDHRGFSLRIETLGGSDYIPRGGRFVEIAPNRCFYVPVGPIKAQRMIVESWVSTSGLIAKAEAAGLPEEVLRQLRPQVRSFPRARLSRFEVLQPGEF